MREKLVVRLTKDIDHFCSGETTIAHAPTIMSIIHGNIRETDDHLTRRTFYAAVLIAAFEFLKRASVGEVTIMGIQFTEFTVVEKVLPAIIAYLSLSCWMLIANRRLMEDIYDEFVQHLYPELWKSDLELYLRPPHFIKTYNLLMRESQGLIRRLLNASVLFPIVALWAIAPVFCGYALYSLYIKYSYDILSIVSGIFCVFFVLQTFLVLAGVDRITKDVETTASESEMPSV
jgi:hypothetical protein